MGHCSVQVCWFPCSESHTQISCWRNQKQDLVKSDLYVWSPVRNVIGDKRTHAQINPPKNCVIYTLRPCLSSVDFILGQWLFTISSLFVSINLKAGMLLLSIEHGEVDSYVVIFFGGRNNFIGLNNIEVSQLTGGKC